MQAQIEPVPISYTRGCDFGTPLGQQEALDCTWFPQARGSAIYLVGDSQAAQFAEATINAAEPLERSATIATEGSCAFLLREPDEDLETSPECDAYVTQSIEWLSTQPPATVLIGISGNYVTEGSAGVVANRLQRSISALQESGHQVKLFQAIPQFFGWSPFNCSVLEALRDSQGCGASVAITDMDERQALPLEIFAEVAQETKVDLIDTRPQLCTDATCTTNVGDIWRYRDMFHISVGESQRLAEQVRSALLR
jgi:hypothetical protein